MVKIPQAVFDQYNAVMDDFITDNFGVNCRLSYQALQVECPNCIVDLIGHKSSNLYKSGGPQPFNDGMICPYCNGEGFRLDTPEEVVKVRVYWTKKEWLKLGDNVNIPDGSVQVIGFMTDMPKFKRANHCHILSDQIGANDYKFALSAEVFPWGFKKNRYFVGYLTRI